MLAVRAIHRGMMHRKPTREKNNVAITDTPSITDTEFNQFRDLIYRIAGIKLADTKKVLLVGRLARRLRHHQMSNFSDYFRLVSSPGQANELQEMVDLLTTNETYFFREPAHFEFLKTLVSGHPPGRSFDVWSAASSTGEEIYTIAMVLADKLGLSGNWTVTGSDLSTKVLAVAQRGSYVLDRTRGLSEDYRRKYCQPCSSGDPGSFEIKPDIKRHTRFMQVNLNRSLPPMNRFNLIFVRNVMIYFDANTKRQVVERLVSRLQPGGHLIVGHSESLAGLTETLQQLKPTIYQLPDAPSGNGGRLDRGP